MTVTGERPEILLEDVDFNRRDHPDRPLRPIPPGRDHFADQWRDMREFIFGEWIDVDDTMLAESMSIETEYGCRFVLRGDERVAFERPAEPRCDVPDTVSALRERGPQELPEALRRARMR